MDTGPHHLIDFGLLDQIKELGYDVSFGGHQQFAEIMTMSKLEDPDIGKLKRPRYVGNVTQSLSKAVEERCRKGELVLTLGGDHSLAIGTVSGVFAAYSDACLIWIDAVCQIYAGALTVACGYQHTGIDDVGEYPWHACIVSHGTCGGASGVACMGTPLHCCVSCQIPHCLRPDRIAYIGLRDVDPDERRILREYNIAAFSMYHVDKYGIGKVVEMALDRVNPNRDRPVFGTSLAD